jgi:uncharacterized protein (TIGR03437 family)
MRSITTTTLFLLALAIFPRASSAQVPYDSSGDGMLNGAYYLRQVVYVNSSQQLQGAVGEAINVQGTITFDGHGNYAFSGSLLDSSSGTSTPTTGVNATGTYVISASGMGYITAVNPELTATDLIVGLVSHGIFIGSSTQNGSGYNDLMIAAPIGSTATNATLKGTYQVAYFDPTYPGDALFSMTADGSGNAGNASVQEYTGYTGASTAQNLSGMHYAFSNGAAQFTFGGTVNGTQLIAGTDLLYISPDGNFIFGGSYNGYDMFVGVRAATGNPSNYDGLYYQAGLDFDVSTINSDYVLLDSYYGSLNAFSGNIIGHQSVNNQLIYGGASDLSYFDTYTLSGNGSSTDLEFNQQYWSSVDGSIRIGYGLGPLYALNVALKAPTLTGNGVYLNPQGVVNAASSAPFTAHLSPGEFITLYGTGLAPSDATATTLPLPGILNGVQVMINGRPAPMYFVSSTQLSVIVPYFTESIAQIQVINNGKSSNVVTQFVGSTSGGVFTFNPVGGIGYAAALHNADFSVVSPDSPAQIGETIDVFTAGMGIVSPTVLDGAADPSGTLSSTPYTPSIFIADSAGNDTQVTTVSYSGLAPGFAGLYQINFTIPSGVASGPTSLEILGPDSDTLEAGLPVGSPADNLAPAARAKALGKTPLIHRHRLARPTGLTANQP